MVCVACTLAMWMIDDSAAFLSMGSIAWLTAKGPR
jgi:hypothetical protein